jgi:hypothetical protein
MTTSRVSRAELLTFRRALLEELPVGLRVRLQDIDHLLGWTEQEPLRLALEDALEGMQDMRPYVAEYFADKWEHDAYISRARTALGQEPHNV